MKLVLAPMQDVTDLAFMRTLQRIGSLPDAFITHGSRVQLLDDCGLSAQKIAGEIVKSLQQK